MTEKYIYKVTFVNQEQIYEIYVKSVYQADMYGFIIIEDFVFGEKSSIVVDPTEERLRIEFDGVDRSFIPIHKIIRIDQVKKRGTAKIFAVSKEATEHLSKTSVFFTPDKK